MPNELPEPMVIVQIPSYSSSLSSSLPSSTLLLSLLPILVVTPSLPLISYICSVTSSTNHPANENTFIPPLLLLKGTRTLGGAQTTNRRSCTQLNKNIIICQWWRDNK